MAVNRRAFLKTLTLSATLPYLDLGIARALVANPPKPTKVYILLHGMFFLEFDDKNLWVATPRHPKHKVCLRRHGEVAPDALPPGDMLFTNKLQAGSKSKFPDGLVKFPKSALSATSYVLSHAAKYYCRMRFPWPDDILALRQAPKTQFCPSPTSNIGKQLTYGSNVSNITCLVFKPGAEGPYVESYYAEHACRPSVDQVNAALTSAQSLCGSGFDLTMMGCNPPVTPLDPPQSLPDGVSIDDEKALFELHTCVSCCSPSDCPQLGIT